MSERRPGAPGKKLVCLLLSALAGLSAIADQVQVAPSKDNTMYAEGDLSNGAGNELFTSLTLGGVARRALVAFDITSAIPAGATINSVSLRMWCSRVRTAATTPTVGLHRVQSDWGEGLSQAGGNEGQGATPTAGDATWTHTFYPGSFWTTLGGDFSPSPSASLVIADIGFYTWNSAGMVADVQSWLDTPGANFGWVMVGNETQSGSAKRFSSRQNDTEVLRPLLTVDFTAPMVTGGCCTGMSCSIETEAACLGMGGSYQGDGTNCTPDPCSDPVGACCTDLGLCSEVTQSQCTLSGGAFQGQGSTCAAAECPVMPTPFLDALPIPPVATPTSGSVGGVAEYDIWMREAQLQLHSQLPATTVWGFDDGLTGTLVPGPTLEAGVGQTVTVDWINDLRETGTGNLRTDHVLPVDTNCIHGAANTAKTVVHLHGAHTEEQYDGYPEFTYTPGFSDQYIYENNQIAQTLWYHDHSLGITRLNVQMGLAGFYLIRDAAEAALNLPAGEFEVPLAIFDRTFNADGSFQYPAAWTQHFFGNTNLVNGKVWPYLDAKQGKYRFRLLNASGSRTYTLAFQESGGPVSFSIIGTDGGLLEAPVTVTELTFAPGERYDIVVDFAGFAPGTEIFLENSAGAPFPNGGVDMVDVMKLNVIAAAGHTDALPSTLTAIDRIAESEAVQTRELRLNRGGMDACGNSPWLINGLGWDDITEYPELGTVEIWTFVNDSGIAHPMHMHLNSFQILDRDGFTINGADEVVPDGNPVLPAAEEDGWKDTAIVYPNELLRVITRFTDYEGRFAYHCHILEHEDNEMMRQFRTVPPVELTLDGGDINWTAVFGAASYDVTRGSLGALRSGAGDFAAATKTCLANDTASGMVSDASDPAEGTGYWYLVRKNDPSAAGTYDSGSSSQVGMRDAEIDASGNACP